MAEVYVFFADGFEEIEGLTVVDLLRRAKVPVHMVSIQGKQAICINADISKVLERV